VGRGRLGGRLVSGVVWWRVGLPFWWLFGRRWCIIDVVELGKSSILWSHIVAVVECGELDELWEPRLALSGVTPSSVCG
jgi:hypothetical protein